MKLIESKESKEKLITEEGKLKRKVVLKRSQWKLEKIKKENR
ncbi:MAG: hypothetical protein ACPLRH_05790 [Desulfotomaculales bacterium]